MPGHIAGTYGNWAGGVSQNTKLAPVPVLAKRPATYAHRILGLAEYGEHELACPGAVKTRRVDRIASVIMDEFAKSK